VTDDALNEIRYGRDSESLRIFISSKMDGSLDEERRQAAEAVDRLDAHKAWWWEQDAPAGVLHSEKECIGIAATSDGLILLIAGAISPIIYAEYDAARGARAATYIFIRDDANIPEAERQFIQRERMTGVTRNFRNTAELETHVYQSLKKAAVRAMRDLQIHRRAPGGR
jgi:hypothetical protein